jgi:chitin synthase
METLHTIGLVIFVFAVLPELNVIKAAMLTNCLCFIPGILALLSRNSDENMYYFKIMADVCAIIGQLSAFIFWFVIDTESSNLKFSLPISCILISIGYWENYCGN